MTASIPSKPEWLAAWVAKSTSLRAALDHFDCLLGAHPAEVAGVWRGRSLPTGHPLDGLLETLGWYGKEILPDGLVHPLLFRHPSGRLVALEPAWMPAGIALRWPALARGHATQAAFRALGPLLQARRPSARIELREFRGRRGPAVVYDRQPIVDHLRRLDADRLIGLMERHGMADPYLFLLSRESAAPVSSSIP